MLRKVVNTCNMYVVLWLLGYIQNMYFNSSFLSMVFYIPFTLMTMYYIKDVVFKYRTSGVMRVMMYFFLFLCVYGIGLLIYNDAEGQDPKSFLMMLFSSLGPIFPFYVFTKRGDLTIEKIKICFVVFLSVAIMEYFVYEQKAMMLLMLNSSFDEITNNSTYYFVALLPFIFFFNKKPFVQYLLIACIMGFVLSGMKRGAILISTILLLWFVVRTIKDASTKKRLWVICILLLFVFIGFHFVENLYNTSDYFQKRMEDTVSGQSSGRDRLYSTYWSHYINNDNIVQLLFGEGAYHTVNILHLKAHNDWLELLIDCGLCGAILYFVYWYFFFKMWKKSKVFHVYYSVVGACLLYTFIRTFFSMSFSDMPFSMCMLLGYTFAMDWRNLYSINYGKNIVMARSIYSHDR